MLTNHIHKMEIKYFLVFYFQQPAAPYAVITVQAYTSKHWNGISFQQEDKFDVVGFESKRWLIGEKNGSSGLSTSEYVKVNSITVML